jgi:5-methylcytosine-specific restriction endonuclease McrA
MAYMDWTDAEVVALTRERRRERLLGLYMAEEVDVPAVRAAYMRLHGSPLPEGPTVVRFSVLDKPSVGFRAVVQVFNVTDRRAGAAKRWREREWRAGVRTCHYCGEKMVCPPKNGPCGPMAATVDHRHPLVLGGDDAPWNWVMACWTCNNDKGGLSEEEFISNRRRKVA